MYNEFNFFSSVFPVLFVLVFILILGMIVAQLVRNVNQYRKNEASPKLTVGAKVVAKREAVSHNTVSARDTMANSSHTTYFATFEVESGDRMELSMAGTEYGMLAEGDWGRLTFQGTRYLGFERAISSRE